MKNGKRNVRQNNNRRSNLRHQANVIGQTDPFVLLTAIDDLDTDSGDEMPGLIPVDLYSDSNSDCEDEFISETSPPETGNSSLDTAQIGIASNSIDVSAWDCDYHD